MKSAIPGGKRSGVQGTARRPRIAVFTHDTYGLGHVRRSLRVMRGVALERPHAALLLVTGSPAIAALQDLPPGSDFVKIPTLARTGPEDRRPPHLPIPLDDVTAMRQEIVRQAVVGFAPDVFLVDNFPLGARRELLPVLTALRDTGTRTVLGLRDILDAPEIVRRDWTRLGVYEALERLYDRILIYGPSGVVDPLEAYAFSKTIAAKTRFCGYVSDPPLEAAAPAGDGAPGPPGPFLLATGGGGGDGYPLLRTFIEALELLPAIPALISTGPLMSIRDREDLSARVDGRAGVQISAFVPDLHRLFPRAEVVVSMCGYNTAAEIVAHRARAIVVPRTWRYGEHAKGNAAGIEWEQLLRARALNRLGLVDVIEPDGLTPASLAEGIRKRRREPPPDAPDLDLGGAAAVARNLLELAEQEGGGA